MIVNYTDNRFYLMSTLLTGVLIPKLDMLRVQTEIEELNLYTPTSQNGQTHSNNSSAIADVLLECI